MFCAVCAVLGIGALAATSDRAERSMNFSHVFWLEVVVQDIDHNLAVYRWALNMDRLEQGGIRTWTVWGGHRGRCGSGCRNRCLEGAQKDFAESSGIHGSKNCLEGGIGTDGGNG